jgi:hypothetical protein
MTQNFDRADQTAADWTDEEYLTKVIICPCPDDNIEAANETGYFICQDQNKNGDNMVWAISPEDYAEWKDHPVVKSFRFAKCGS